MPGEGKDGEKIIKGVDRHEGDGKVVPVEEKKSRNVIERTVWTFIMIGGFIGGLSISRFLVLYCMLNHFWVMSLALLCMGHPYMILLVMICQALVYKEVTALFALRDREFSHFNSGNSKSADSYIYPQSS
jgi:phosphatidate cytidylyltransferase